MCPRQSLTDLSSNFSQFGPTMFQTGSPTVNTITIAYYFSYSGGPGIPLFSVAPGTAPETSLSFVFMSDWVYVC